MSHKPIYALLVGCEYLNTRQFLPGCMYDVAQLKSMLIRSGVPNDHIQIMTDREGVTPTARNVKFALQKLIAKSKQGPCQLFFSFSGHGFFIDGNEADGHDECIYLLRNTYLVDNELHTIVSNIDDRSDLFILTDACHSGTDFDLKYAYQTPSTLPTTWTGTKPNIVKFSGCQDSQTSASVLRKGTWKGALTTAFISSLEMIRGHAEMDHTWVSIYKNVCAHLRNMSQKPVLSCNTTGNPGETFIV